MKTYKDIFIDLDNTIYDTKYLEGPRPVEGAMELLDYLQKKGYRLHICSNGSRQGRLLKLQSLGITRYFHCIVTSEDAQAEKPDPQFFLYALSKAEASADSTIMIGDNFDTDMQGATASGIDTLLFNRWERDWIPPHPVTYSVNSLTEIFNIL